MTIEPDPALLDMSSYAAEIEGSSTEAARRA